MQIDFDTDVIEEADSVQLCFIRKKRIDHEPKYYIYSASLTDEPDGELKKWLLDAISEVDSSDFPSFDLSSDDNMQHVDLTNIDVWEQFLGPLLGEDVTPIDNLNLLKKHLLGYMVFYSTNGLIQGYARKLTSGRVLDKKHFLDFSEGVFNFAGDREGIDMDPHADFVFKLTGDSQEAIAVSKSNFKKLMDMKEQMKRQALDLVGSFEHIQEHDDYDKVRELVGTDRNIQKMLSNPVAKDYHGIITFDVMQGHKQRLGNQVAFEVDPENEMPIFPPSNFKQAVHDFFKLMCHHYSQMFGSEENVLEGHPKRVHASSGD